MKPFNSLTRRGVLLGGLALAVTAGAVGPAIAHGGGGTGSERATLERQLADVRRATARYNDVRRAVADGYIPTDVCVSSPDGTMGYHYVNPAVTTLDPTRPAILVYVPAGQSLRLGAVEWFVPDADGDLGTDTDRPSLFGRPFDGPMPGHEPGMPVHYDLHAWLWAHNPDGVFAPWNRALSC